MNPMSCNFSTRWSLNAAPEPLRPYNAFFTTIIEPFSEPNSGPARVQIFSLHSAVKYAFCISHAITLNSFSAAIVSAIRMESRETTDEYVSVLGVCHMSTFYQSRLGPKFLSELHVEDHVTPHELVFLWDVVLTSFKHLKSGADVFHFLTDGVPPKCVPILFIYLPCLVN